MERERPEAEHALTYVRQSGESSSEAGDQYAGLDRFGRVIDQRWTLDAGGHADRFQYGHDRNGNRLYEENLLESTLSELYHDGTGYDALNRLGAFSRGMLNGTKDGLTGSASRSQDWSLDALGNWNSVVDETSTIQTRTHDDQNRLTGVSGASAPTFSPNGEMLSDETGQVLAYDAWGRLVAVDVDADSVVDVSYAYDALNRKVLVDEGSGEKAWYYTQEWQVLEERDAASGDVEVQYVWSPAYVDAMILRDRDTDPNSAGLEERVYVTHDANFNVTSIIGHNGTDWEVVERYVFDPYGERTVLNADWTVDTDGLSDFAFVHGHQGGRHYLATGLVDFRNRHLDTSLGRWERQDPAGYVDGGNLYTAYQENSIIRVDPSGQWWSLVARGVFHGGKWIYKGGKWVWQKVPAKKDLGIGVGASVAGAGIYDGLTGDSGEIDREAEDGSGNNGDHGSPGLPADPNGEPRHPIFGPKRNWPQHGVRYISFDDSHAFLFPEYSWGYQYLDGRWEVRTNRDPAGHDAVYEGANSLPPGFGE